jgi:hypothetical protein
MTGAWEKQLEAAVELLHNELIAAPGRVRSELHLLSCGRNNGIGPKMMKQAAAKLGIEFERHVHPNTGCIRTYWDTSAWTSVNLGHRGRHAYAIIG